MNTGRGLLVLQASAGLAAIFFAIAVQDASAQYSVAPVNNGGTIVGTVTYAGDAPSPKKLEVTKDIKVCGKETKYDESLLVGEDSGLVNVVVSITGITTGKGFPEDAKYEVDQRGCVFRPHVQVIRAQVPITFINSDRILHNMHTFSEKNRPVNKAQPKFKKRMRHTFKVPEIVSIKCDAHGWMSAWVVVAEHPYYAVTDDSGSFVIENVPPGTYTLDFWHEKLGTKTAEVTVPAGKEATANLAFQSEE